MHFQRATRSRKPINITPLIDVVFLLIVFFMLTTSFIKIDSIEMNLPPAEDSSVKQKAVSPKTTEVLDKLMVVDVAASGAVYVNNKRVPKHELESYLRGEVKRRKQKEVLVRVAERVSVQKLVHLMDLVHVAGARDVAVAEWDGYVPEEVVEIPMIEALGLPTYRDEVLQDISTDDVNTSSKTIGAPKAPPVKKAPVKKLSDDAVLETIDDLMNTLDEQGGE